MIDARAYLQSIRRADSIIQLKMQQIQRLKDQLFNLSVPLDQEQVSHTKNVEIMAETIATILDKQKELDRESNEIAKKKCETIELLCQLPIESAQILIDHFLEGKTILEISKSMFITKRQAQRRVHTAVSKFQQILNDSTA